MARKDRENLEQLMASNPKLQEQLEERVAAAVAEARAAWEAEQEVPEEEVAEPSEPEEAVGWQRNGRRWRRRRPPLLGSGWKWR